MGDAKERQAGAFGLLKECIERVRHPHKFDGFRCLAQRDGERVELTSKNGQPLGRYFPEVVAALARLPANAFSLDGELVVPVGKTLAFDVLQQRIHPADSRVALLARTTPARYLAFDILRFDGLDWIERPLHERRAELERFAARFPLTRCCGSARRPATATW